MLEVLGVLALLYFGGTPLAIYQGSRASMHPRIEALDPEALPPDVLVFLDDSIAAVEALGFQPVGFVRLPDAVPQLDSYLALLTHPVTDDKAMVTAILVRGNDGAVTRKTLYTEFSARFASGRTFQTLNADTPGAFRPLPHERKLQAPHVRDLARLYRLHRYHIERLGDLAADDHPVRFTETDIAGYLSAELIRDYDEQVALGLFRRDEGAQVYRPTLRGAYEMAWKALWPGSALRREALDREGRAIEARMLAEG